MNSPIDVADIPQLSDANFVRVSGDYLKATAIPYRVLQAVALLVFAGAAIGISPWLLIAGVITIAVLEVTPFLRRLAFPYLGYQVREHDFSVRYGLITRTVETVPYNRIQNTEVNQGPLERRFRLATLTVSPARGALRIPGLPEADAHRLRAFIAQTAAIVHEADADGA